jgi:hypothetical protein
VHQTPNRNAINSATTPVRQNQARAHVNHVAMEDAQDAPDVIIGMILVNDNNAIVLFDFGASHSFVTTNFVKKYNLPLSMVKNWMIISSLVGDMHARHVCPKVSILIGGGVEFLANLIVLESMTSSGKELEYVAENMVTDKTATNRIVLNHLDAASTFDIRTVSEFLDVFSRRVARYATRP